MILPAALRRVVAHRTVTAAASLTVLLAALTFSVLVATATAISDSGTRRALAEAPPDATAAVFTAALTSDDPGSADAAVASAARRILRPFPVKVTKALVSAQLTLAGPTGATTVGVAVADEYPKHIRMSAGTLLAEDGDLVIPESVARQTGAGVGDKVTVTKALWGGTGTETHRVAGIYQVADADPGFWGAVQQNIDGKTGRQAPVVFATPGMLAPKEHLASLAQLVWFALPDLHGATVSGVETAVQRILTVENGDANRAVFHSETPTVNSLSLASRLPMELAQIKRAEVAGMSGFLIVGTLLAVLAAFAVGLTLKLLREHRAEETRLVRARGADGRRLLAAAGGEALLVSVPALVLAPPVTGPLCRRLHGLPGLANLPAPHAPVSAGMTVSILILAFCVAVQGAAAVAEARERISKGFGRSPRAAAFQRAGADAALAAVAVLGYLQLRHYKSPVTAGRGAFAIDPVLVVAPAVTAAALATLALRLLPFAAGLADRRIRATSGLPGALGGWQVSRRAARHAGTVLLLVLALAVGAMTVTGTAMRARSADDRAAFQLGADLRVTGSALPPEAQRSNVSGLPGVRSATPVALGTVDLGSSKPTLVGVDAAEVGQVLRLRTDLADGDAAKVFAPLAAGRQDGGVQLPGRPTGVTFQLSTDHPELGGTLIMALRDRDGAPLVRSVPMPMPMPNATGRAVDVTVPLTPEGGEGYGLAYPLSFEGFDYDYPVVGGRRVEALISISTLRSQPGGAPLEMPSGQPWHGFVRPLAGGLNLTSADDCGPVAETTGPPLLMPKVCRVEQTSADTLTVRIASGEIPADVADQIRSFTVGFRAGEENGPTAPSVPVLATDRFLQDNGRNVGDKVFGEFAGTRVMFVVAGRLTAFPGVSPDTPALVVDRPSLAALLSRYAAEAPWATSWLAATGPGGDRTAAAAVAGHAEFGTTASRTEVAARLRGGAFTGSAEALLLIAAATAPFFAMVGFTVSAVAALRNRRKEFAVLRALGARPRQLSGALWVEQVVLALVAVTIGLGIGVLTAAGTVPLVTVDDGGAAVFPTVLVVTPWLRGALVAAGTASAVLVVVMGAARALGRVDLARMLRAGEET